MRRRDFLASGIALAVTSVLEARADTAPAS